MTGFPPVASVWTALAIASLAAGAWAIRFSLITRHRSGLLLAIASLAVGLFCAWVAAGLWRHA